MSNHEHEHCGCGCEHHDHKPVADKYMTAINQSNVTIDDAAVAAAVQEIIDKHAAENNTPEVQQFLLNIRNHISRLIIIHSDFCILEHRISSFTKCLTGD